MWFFFSLVIDVQNLFVQIIYELTSPCIDVLSSAEWLAPLFQFIFSYLVANNLLFLQWKVLFLSQASLIHGTPGCTKPSYLTIKSNCSHVECVKLSNYLFFEGNCSVKSELRNRHQYLHFTNSVLTETKI